jgi:hypothetical protein
LLSKLRRALMGRETEFQISWLPDTISKGTPGRYLGCTIENTISHQMTLQHKSPSQKCLSHNAEDSKAYSRPWGEEWEHCAHSHRQPTHTCALNGLFVHSKEHLCRPVLGKHWCCELAW